MHWWKRPKLDYGMGLLPASAFPAFPRSPSYRVDDTALLFSRSSGLEKVVIRRAVSYEDTSSNAPPLLTTTPAPLSSANLTTNLLELPSKRHPQVLRHLRLSLFTVYRRIFSLILVSNLIGLCLVLRNIKSPALDRLTTWASLNFLIAVIVRQDFFINLVFRTAWLVPWSFPLRVRRLVARVYTYGGIHSGAAVAGTMWFSVSTVLITTFFVQQRLFSLSIVVTTWFILVLLVLIILLAFPLMRAKYHNTFEITHRFLGWTTIALLWVQLLLLTHHISRTSSAPVSGVTILLRSSPAFWSLLATTLILIYPWLRLRRWTFTSEVLSSHALCLHFQHHIHRFSYLSLSSSPLTEWHPFATFPSGDPEQLGGSMVISAAGDWTRLLLESQIRAYHRNTLYPRTHRPTIRLWTRGIVKPGVLSLTCVFQRVVVRAP